MPDNKRRRIKVYNRMFMDAEYTFSSLKFYHREVTSLLSERARHFRDYTDQLDEDSKRRNRPFDKDYWLSHYDVYTAYYPQLFNNSFVISACSLFEFQVKKICELVKEEHEVPLEWDDMEGSVPARARRFLWNAGIQLTDDPPKIVLSPPDFAPTEVYEKDRFVAQALWTALENYFRVRNCMTHHNGLVDKVRSAQRLTEYASQKGILGTGAAGRQLALNAGFNNELCDGM